MSERYLVAIFHFHVVNLVNASNHQVDQDVGWSVHGVHGGGPYPGIVNVLIQNSVEDVFFFKSLTRVISSIEGGGSLEDAPVGVTEDEKREDEAPGDAHHDGQEAPGDCHHHVGHAAH